MKMKSKTLMTSVPYRFYKADLHIVKKLTGQ